MKELLENKWNEAMSYSAYLQLMDQLVEEGRTTGENQSESMVHLTKMAAQRIRKWGKIYNVSESTKSRLNTLRNNLKNNSWLIIVEGWCGDVGQNLVPLQKIAIEAGIELRLILRDEHLDLIDNFLTNGGRSIPKLICFDNTDFSVLWEWGPRPSEVQNWFLNEKEKPGFDKNEVSERMHLWYAKNKHQELEKEILELLTKEAK